MTKTLAVIGAGVKAIAVAAKAAELRAMGVPAPEVVAIERTAVAANWQAAGGWTDHLLRCDRDGRLHAHVAQAQASFRLLPFSQATAWITLPSDLGDVGAGTPVQVHGLSHLQPPAWMPA